MRENLPDIQIRARGGSLAARDGVVVSFFIHRAPEVVAPAVWRAIQTYLRAIPPKTLGWYVSDDGELAPLDDAGWEHIRKYLIEAPWNGAWPIELLESPSEAAGYQVEYYGRRLNDPILEDPVTSVTFTFPTGYLLEHGAPQLRALAIELARELPFHFGYASLALVSPQGLFGSGDWKLLEALLSRYPGLDIYHSRKFSSVIGTHALSASWLTFLGQPLLGRLGGSEALQAALAFPEVSLLKMEVDRLLIILDEWPDPIDTEKGPIPPRYQALASLLKPFMYEYKGDTDGLLLHMNRWHRRLCP